MHSCVTALQSEVSGMLTSLTDWSDFLSSINFSVDDGTTFGETFAEYAEEHN